MDDLDDHSGILGIDIGSVSISVAAINSKRELRKTSYQFHYCNIAGTLKKILNDFDLQQISGIAATSSTPAILTINRQYDNRVSLLSGIIFQNMA